MRTKNAMLNALTNVFGQIFILLLNFVGRKIFLYVLDANYLGISGLFHSVITMLSLAELGVGTAITYSLYKPLLEKNDEVILSLMSLYKKIYRVIGIIILLVGIAITPLVMFMTKLEVEIPNIEIIYILFVVNTAVSYFFSYNRTLIVADQKEYKLAGIDYLSKLGLIIFQSIFLILSKEYIWYLVIQIVMTFLQNLLIFLKVQKMYPVMRSKQVKRLPENILQDVKKNTLAMMIYKLAVVIVAGTDNLIISKFLGTIWVGLYSNYSMIFSSIQTICSKMITAVTSTIGNVIADGDTERSYKVFEAMQYICFWIYGICSIELFILSSSFVALFFGHEYLIPTSTILVVSINFYLLGMQGGTSVFRDAQGIFWQGKLRPLLQGVLNLVISIVLVKWMGNLTAVFLGTVISRVLTITWFDPYVIHKYGFKDMSKIKIFIKKYVRYIILTIVAGIVAFLLSSLYSGNSIGGLIYRMLVSAIIVFAVFLGFTFKTQEFNFLYEIVKNMLKKNKR